MKEHDFRYFLLPPYSSFLNPIERVWAVFKRKWMDYLASQCGGFNGNDIEMHVKKVLDEEVRSSKNFWKAGFGDYRNVLG